jgi:hypothetical protein
VPGTPGVSLSFRIQPMLSNSHGNSSLNATSPALKHNPIRMGLEFQRE